MNSSQQSTMTTAPSPSPSEAGRYEFRIFGDDCHAVAERIERKAVKQGEDRSADRYILAAAVDDQNCKIREGHIEVKALVAETANLEQWRPTLDQPFPVPAAWLRGQLFPTLKKRPPSLPRDAYTENQFLEEVVMSHPRLSTVLVVKHRMLFTLNDCRLEVGALHIAERLPTWTIALEAEEAALVQETQLQLGLQNYANTNYIQMLKQLL